ncbi:hypothetical protein NTGM5_560003 [Candidatus Nitrotoga sp. M5]|nr:hypothetical protein NTGM5_560003 [Candidatus Nitrotoga sp. M5]
MFSVSLVHLNMPKLLNLVAFDFALFSFGRTEMLHWQYSSLTIDTHVMCTSDIT